MSDDGKETEDSSESDYTSSSSSDNSSDVEYVKVKLVHNGEVRASELKTSYTYPRLRRRIRGEYGANMRVHYEDDESDQVVIRSTKDLQLALKEQAEDAHDRKRKTLRLHLTEATQGELGASTSSIFSSGIGRGAMNSSCTSPAAECQAPSAEGSGGAGALRWQKGELLGQGSFGRVFAALDLRKGIRYAVKTVSLQHTRSGHSYKGSKDGLEGMQVAALQKEISLLETISHPHIIRYLGTQRNEDELFIFLEFASEGSVQQALRRFGPFSEAVVRKFSSELLDGLSYLHSSGIIHRDIKVSNILLDKGMVKLADFGCSKRIRLGGCAGDADALDQSEQHFSIVGTASYLAPEVLQLDGAGSHAGGVEEESIEHTRGEGYGRSSDIWALGLAILEMMTGTAPFSSPAAAIYKLLVLRQAPDVRHVGLSAVGQAFVGCCLQLNPSDRPEASELQQYQFCKEVASDPRHYTTMQPTTNKNKRRVDLDPEIETLYEGGEERDVDSSPWRAATTIEAQPVDSWLRNR